MTITFLSQGPKDLLPLAGHLTAVGEMLWLQVPVDDAAAVHVREPIEDLRQLEDTTNVGFTNPSVGFHKPGLQEDVAGNRLFQSSLERNVFCKLLAMHHLARGSGGNCFLVETSQGLHDNDFVTRSDFSGMVHGIHCGRGKQPGLI